VQGPLQHSVVDTTSREEAAREIARVFPGFAPQRERDEGPFRFRQSLAVGPRLSMARTQLSGRMHGATEIDDPVTVGALLRGRLALEHRGSAVDTARPWVLPRGLAHGGSSGLDAFLVTFDRAALEAFGRGLADVPGPLRFTGTGPVDQAGATRWARLVGRVAAQLSPEVIATPDDRVRRLAFGMLASQLLETFPNTWREAIDAARPAGGLAPRAVHLALLYIYEHLDADIDAASLAHAAGLSVRGLQAAFRRELDATPGEIVRDARLDAARDALRRARPGETTVHELAARFGFGNPGRFAGRYLARFGEPPNATLRG
jgi:AraC-like DNA-binding protein